MGLFTSLPVDILLTIFDHLEPPDIARLQNANQRMGDICRQILWKTIALHPGFALKPSRERVPYFVCHSGEPYDRIDLDTHKFTGTRIKCNRAYEFKTFCQAVYCGELDQVFQHTRTLNLAIPFALPVTLTVQEVTASKPPRKHSGSRLIIWLLKQLPKIFPRLSSVQISVYVNHVTVGKRLLPMALTGLPQCVSLNVNFDFENPPCREFFISDRLKSLRMDISWCLWFPSPNIDLSWLSKGFNLPDSLERLEIELPDCVPVGKCCSSSIALLLKPLTNLKTLSLARLKLEPGAEPFTISPSIANLTLTNLDVLSGTYPNVTSFSCIECIGSSHKRYRPVKAVFPNLRCLYAENVYERDLGLFADLPSSICDVHVLFLDGNAHLPLIYNACKSAVVHLSIYGPISLGDASFNYEMGKLKSLKVNLEYQYHNQRLGEVAELLNATEELYVMNNTFTEKLLASGKAVPAPGVGLCCRVIDSGYQREGKSNWVRELNNAYSRIVAGSNWGPAPRPP
ncbi:hypothetical protein TRVA0_010S02806 [Trichomonascus vanleenenianus]|uniref:F-box protein n=1 Tax=Trichomonascus vanleenenianus TaxID=2268995 RepID=UPI003ECAC084